MFFWTNKPQAGHCLSDDEMRLLRALRGQPGRRWVPGLEVCRTFLDAKTIHSFHVPEINKLVATGKSLEARGFVQSQRSNGRIDWDLKLTNTGRTVVERHPCTKYGTTAFALALVAACTTTPKAPDLPAFPHNASKSATVPKIIQTRDAGGNLQWTQCTENCPQPTPKRAAGEAPAVTNMRLKNLPGVANPVHTKPAAAEGMPIQTMPALADPAGTRAPARSTVGTMQVPVEYSVFFRTGSSVLAPASRSVIEALGDDALRAMRIEVVGRADTAGQRIQNEQLAAKRANAIKAVLVGEGVEPQNITIRQVVEDSGPSSSSTSIGHFPSTQIEQSRRADLTLVLLQLKKS